MKNIETILTELGIQIPADKKDAFTSQFGENYKTAEETNRLRTARDDLKSQLDGAKEQLKSFEGIDVSDLKSQIAKLNGDLTAKDNEYKAKIADMEFSAVLDGAISASGAKNSKAVKALLDVDKLRASTNRDADIKSALEVCKTDNDYLFKSDEPVNNPVAPTGGATGSDPFAAVRAAMGLEPKK
nr:MAG TPA: minor structural protein [Caudoviricetes sp.]